MRERERGRRREWFIETERERGGGEYSGSHLFYAKLWTVADQKPMVKKIWKKYGKSWDGLPSSPKSKRGQKPFGILPWSPSPIFWGLWGVFRRQMCAVISGWVDNCVLVGQRPYACLTISGSGVRCAAYARHNRGLHIRFSLMKKVPFGRFQPLSFDFISRNNGSWAF